MLRLDSLDFALPANNILNPTYFVFLALSGLCLTKAPIPLCPRSSLVFTYLVAYISLLSSLLQDLPSFCLSDCA